MKNDDAKIVEKAKRIAIALSILSGATAGCGVASICFTGPGWSSIFCAFFAGVNGAAAFYQWLLSRSHVSNAQLAELCSEQQEMINAFLQDRVQVHIESMTGIQRPDQPMKPKLH